MAEWVRRRASNVKNESPQTNRPLILSYSAARERTMALCQPLQTEDMVVQPTEDISPPKWHLGHTTWFFEQFFLSALPGYNSFNPAWTYVFNSYYETVGARVPRPERGYLSRPTVGEIQAYRAHVDRRMTDYLGQQELTPEQAIVVTLGLQHEEQHQELLITDLKYILGLNPLHPTYGRFDEGWEEVAAPEWLTVPGGLYWIGHCADESGHNFCFDNELDRHQVHLREFEIRNMLVSNGEYIEFIEAGGYGNFRYWHADAWRWIQQNDIMAPLYWQRTDGRWHHYRLDGLQAVDPKLPLCHVSFYEAFAFANWKGVRLPTEFEWEVAAPRLQWGQRWEWTHSAYLPYPGYRCDEGALGEYNGKFMVNQMVLRGASVATAPGHSRASYRNFFYPHLRWQYSGIRLARN